MSSKQKIENQRFSLVNDDVRNNCIHEIVRLHEISDKALNIIITEQQETRSNAQNRLYWKWLTQWSEHTGFTKESCHLEFKYMYLAIIFVRDDVGYREMAKSVKKLKGTKEYPSIKQYVIKKTSTKDANTKQMSEYMRQIDMFCYSKDFKLITPKDLEWVRPKGDKDVNNTK